MPEHDDVVPELESCDTKYLDESDWHHLSRLRELVAIGRDPTEVAEVLADIGRTGRNGMVVAIETEVRGLYGLDPSDRYRYVPKEKFALLDPRRLRELVLARLDALAPGTCQVPEAVYRVDIHAIEVDGEVTEVREIARKDWDYLLYVSSSDPQTHFVEIEYGSHAVYSVVKRISSEDSRLLSAGDLAPLDIDRLVDRYR